uniref:glycerol-3-phosphate acyltransferase n=1 Tax=Methylobacter tundripaludum TaxID=173365 RepID=UPI000485C339
MSALVASTLSPVFAWFIVGNEAIVAASAVMTAFLLWRHKSNIQRLLAGEESSKAKEALNKSHFRHNCQTS